MPRRPRPPETQRSEHWLRKAVNEHQDALNSLISQQFGWDNCHRIEWLSPLASDEYAEYYDDDFLYRLGVSDFKVPLSDFWPRSGPRWDALARADSKLILVEAKAYIEEGVPSATRAGPDSRWMIRASLDRTKQAFGAAIDAPWETPFYQYANRLAHLYFCYELNGLDTYLVFFYFADAPDVPSPCTTEQWKGAVRLTKKCLGLGERHPLRDRIAHLIWSDPDLYAETNREARAPAGGGDGASEARNQLVEAVPVTAQQSTDMR
jgi:hypothetical protein